MNNYKKKSYGKPRGQSGFKPKFRGNPNRSRGRFNSKPARGGRFNKRGAGGFQKGGRGKTNFNKGPARFPPKKKFVAVIAGGRGDIFPDIEKSQKMLDIAKKLHHPHMRKSFSTQAEAVQWIKENIKSTYVVYGVYDPVQKKGKLISNWPETKATTNNTRMLMKKFNNPALAKEWLTSQDTIYHKGQVFDFSPSKVTGPAVDQISMMLLNGIQGTDHWYLRLPFFQNLYALNKASPKVSPLVTTFYATPQPIINSTSSDTTVSISLHGCATTSKKAGFVVLSDDKWNVSTLVPTSSGSVAQLLAIASVLQYYSPNINLNITVSSEYAAKSLASWIGKWSRNSWNNNAGKPIRNQALIQCCFAMLNSRTAATNLNFAPSGNPAVEKAVQICGGTELPLDALDDAPTFKPEKKL